MVDDEKVCAICGDSEPFHVHHEGRRIEDYFTVGRGQTDFEAAQAWKRRALAAESAEVERLTPHEARAIRLASIFGTPDPIPPEIASALQKIRAIEAANA